MESYLQSLFYFLLALSVLTIALIGVAVVLEFRKKQGVIIENLAKLAGVLTAVGSLVISGINFSTPLTKVKPEDQARKVIEQFYDSLQAGNYDTAWRLIHEARKEEIRSRHPNFSRNEFAATYATTREYRDRFVSDKLVSNEPAQRTYWVEFDVKDEVPSNHFFTSRQRLVKDLSRSEWVNVDSLVRLAIDNLREHYIVPAAVEPTIRRYILSRQFESILDPLFLAEIPRNLRQDHRIDLKQRSGTPSTVFVWRRFSQEITTSQDGAAWKIRQFEPRATAIYTPSNAP